MTTSQGSLLAAALALASIPSLARAQTADEVPAPETAVDWEAILRGEGRMLTSDAAATRAVETAPGVDRAAASLRQAGANMDRAAYNFMPQASVSLRYTRLSPIVNGSVFSGPSIDPSLVPALVAGVDDPDARFLWEQTLTAQAQLSSYRFPVILDQYAFRASVTYAISDLLLTAWPAFEAAQASVEAARHSVDAQREQVAYDARAAFYDYARARGSLAVALIAEEQANARLRQVQSFVEAGTAARVVELRLRAQVASARVAVARASAGVALAATRLKTLLHLPEDEDLGVGEDVLAPRPPLPGRADTLLERALDRRQDARALRSAVHAAERQTDAAEGSRWPHLGVQANLDVANPNQRVFPQTGEFRTTWDVSAVLSWSPHDVLNGEANAQSARAQRAQSEADLRALEDAIRMQVAEATTSYEAAREALEAARLGLEAATESYRVQMERYRAGATTITDLTDANAELVRSQLELLNAAIDGRLALARLSRATASGIEESP